MKYSKKSLWENKNRIVFLYVIGGVFLTVALLLGIFTGSTDFSLSDFLMAFKNGLQSQTAGKILLYVRLPRTLASAFCGIALSLSGVIIQNVLSNKLASPSVIGVNAGAGFAVTLCTALSLYSGTFVSVFAFLGAFLTVMTVSIASKKWGASRSTVILIGVAVNSLLGAFSDTITTFVPEVSVLSNDFKIGDFSSVTYERLVPAVFIIVFSSLILFFLSNELDVITLGEEQAKSLGLSYELKRTVFLIIAALLAGAAVSVAGLLSFVGLIVPHTVRRIAGNKTRDVLGLSALYGGGFLTLCDTLSRSIFSPYEIPVGIIMAFLGAPFFIFILVRGGKNVA